MKNSTKAEKAHMNAVAQLGCIPCMLDGNEGTPCEIHHVKKHTEHRDHMKVYGACYHHHRSVNSTVPSRHGKPKEFEARYGTDENLLNMVANLLANKNEGFTKIPF